MTSTTSPAAPAVVAGLDLGGTKVLAAAVAPAAPLDVRAEVRRDTPRGAAALVDALAAAVAALDERLAADGHDGVAAVGVGVAGLVDRAGVLRFAPNLPGVVDLDVRTELAARVGRPVTVDNDANCAALAEHRLGASAGSRSSVLLTLGTGIGGGLVIDGAVQRGAFGFAGEPGHMLVDPHGPPCPCGRRGCWERFASGSGLGRLARDAAAAGRASHIVELAGGDPEAVRGEHVTAAALAGDPDAAGILVELAWWVAVGVANLVDLLDPEIVVVGGGLVAAGELLLGPVREAYAGLVLAHDHRPSVPVVAARLGERAGALGAALLAAAEV
ncbi:MAG: ROK family protein [Acidimicrobiales bacterium]